MRAPDPRERPFPLGFPPVPPSAGIPLRHFGNRARSSASPPFDSREIISPSRLQVRRIEISACWTVAYHIAKLLFSLGEFVLLVGPDWGTATWTESSCMKRGSCSTRDFLRM